MTRKISLLAQSFTGIFACAVLMLCAGCVSSQAQTDPDLTPPAEVKTVWQPAPGTSWQWQLDGEIDSSFDVDMYDIDLFDVPAKTIADLQTAGHTVICYFSAGSFEAWRPDAAEFSDAVKGKKMDGWDELWLDIRAPELKLIMRSRLELAAEKGCDGVEPDNVDGYANKSGFPLSAQDQLSYNVFLANTARELSLSVGLKNNLEQVEVLEPYFDWALNEECVQYNECEMLLPFVNAGKAVFGVEYEGEPVDFCPVVNAFDFDWLYKSYDLDAARTSCR